jgi:uncharacterized protein (TIGR03663 family)
MKRWFVPAFLALLVLAAALRLPDLSLRPLHNDEAVNAVKFRGLWDENNYRYDPDEFHGPTLPYFTLPAAWLNPSRNFNDFNETTFRTVTVAFGLGLILLLLLLTRDLGRAEVLWAAAFTAVSPAMVFYSRYYIHEMLLVFFTGLTGLAAWRYGKSKRLLWLVPAGAGLGLMWATKETFVFALLAMGLAVASHLLLERRRTVDGGRWTVDGSRWAGAVGIGLVVGAVFFSSFLTHPAGVLDAFKAYTPWLRRATGAHNHPWNFYFERLLFYKAGGGPIWSEGLIVALAAVGFVAGLKGRWLGGADTALVRLLAFYTFWLTLIYTVLPYKTPWCLLGFYHGMILLAGVGAAVLLRACRGFQIKAVASVLLVAAAAQLGWQAWRGNFAVDRGGEPYCDSVKNPYTYSQTSPDALRLAQIVDALAKVSPDGYGTVIKVMSPDSYWPLPWYLRRFSSVGFWDKIPDEPVAPIMIVSAALRAGFDERGTHLMAGYFELRPNVFYELYVSADLWARHVKTLPPEKD